MTEKTEKERLAAITLQRTLAVLDEEQASSFPEIIRLVHTLSQPRSNVTVAELGDLLEKDATMLVKILQMANSLGYRIGSQKITTVDQAIQVVGFNCICSIAMAMMLLEQSAKPGSEAQREASSVALCAGTFAKSFELGDVDPNLAFICASLSHFGSIAMATTMEEEYREAQANLALMSEDDAFVSVFGMTSRELSIALLSRRRLPTEIFSVISGPADTAVGAVADFSARLSNLVCDQTLSAEAFKARSKKLAAAFSRQLPTIETELPAILTTAGQQLHDLKRSFGITSFPAVVVERVKCRATNKDVGPLPPAISQPLKPAVPKPSEPAAPKPSEPAAPKSSEPAVVRAAISASVGLPAAAEADSEAEILTEGFGEIGVLISEQASALEVCSAAMDIMQSAFGATESCLFLGSSEELKIVHGAGRAWRKLKPRAVIRPGERTVFGVCLEKNTTVLIHAVSSATHVPEWLKTAGLIEAFAALPLKGRHRTGLLLVGWSTRRLLNLTPERSKLVHKLLTAVGDYVGAKPATV